MKRKRLVDLSDQLKPLGELFQSRGYSLYVVGGIVRDALLADSCQTSDSLSGDYDLTTDARPDVILELVSPLASALWTQGERFGTIGATVDERPLEITTYRAEVYDPESRKPVVSFGDDLETDLSRRDFTINAMALKVATAELIDPYGGEDDLSRLVLRTPLEPEISFNDDPLRMLRGCRFIPRFGLTPEPSLEAAATDLAWRLEIVSAERIHDEFERLLAVSDPESGLRFGLRTGLLTKVFSDLASDAQLESGIQLVTKATGQLDSRVRMLAPLGRPGLVEVLKHLRYSNYDRSRSIALFDMSQLLAEVSNGRTDLRRILDRATPDEAQAGLDLARDLSLASDAKLGSVANELEQMIVENDVGPYRLPLDGEALMELFGLGPGPEIGELNKRQKLLQYTNGTMTPESMVRALSEHKE